MSIELVTGHAGSAHVTSAQDGRLNAAAWGTGKYVLPTQAQFAITVDSANQVTVATGDAMLEGRHVTSEAPTALTVDSGTQGMKRNDLVCIVYSKNGSGVESAALQVVKGTETSGTPSDPAIPSGSILAGDTSCAMALWRLPISGITLGTPEQLFEVADELATNENATYTLSYTSSSRALVLTGAGGGASSQAVLPVASASTFGMVKTGSGISNSGGTISVPTATYSVNGLMSADDKTELDALSTAAFGLQDGIMGFGYQNAGGNWYLYFPANAMGKTSVASWTKGSIEISCNGNTYTISTSAQKAATLVNDGALVQVRAETAAVSGMVRHACTAWMSSATFIFG